MIRFDSVTKQYSGTNRPALNSISLEVLRGEFVFLVGASGSGKSSCLRLVLKEEKPSKGSIHVLGQDLGRISSRKVPYFRRNIGVVFQDFRLLNNKSVYENVAFSLQVIGKSRGFIQEAVPDVLNMVGLAGKGSRLPHELSGGEQQRVAIARAVVNKPQILLADEPTGNLDPVTSAGIMAVLERINAGGTTVLMATHEAAIVDQMQRRVIELVNGQMVRDERHGGYGVTTAIPLPDLQQAEAAGMLPAYAALTGAGSGLPPAVDQERGVPVHYANPAVESSAAPLHSRVPVSQGYPVANQASYAGTGVVPPIPPMPQNPASAPAQPSGAGRPSVFPQSAAPTQATPAQAPPAASGATYGSQAAYDPAPGSTAQQPEPVLPAAAFAPESAMLSGDSGDSSGFGDSSGSGDSGNFADSGSSRPSGYQDDADNRAQNSAQNVPAHGSEPRPTSETAEVRLNDHFAARPMHPVLRTDDEDFPEHLRLAERLGLRAPGEPNEEEQNVGPTK